MDDDQVGRAEDDQVDGLQGGDHHLVDSAGYEDQQHAVGEILEKYCSKLRLCQVVTIVSPPLGNES